MSRGPTSEWCSASADAPERASSVLPRTGIAGRTVWSPTRITGVEPGRPEMRSRSSGNETPVRRPALGPREPADRRSLKRAHERPLDEPELSEGGQQRLRRASVLEVDVHAGLRRLVHEEGERLLEGWKVGRDLPHLRER